MRYFAILLNLAALLYIENDLGLMPLETGYTATNFPPYQQPQLPRLSLSYDLVTPLPPMTVPLPRQYSFPQNAGLQSITDSWLVLLKYL